jgi:hypothetical protein
MPLPVQSYEMETACAGVANSFPELPPDRIPGIFAVAQTGEILTLQAPRRGEEWMRLNPLQDEQRWARHNSTMAYLSSSRIASDKMTLDQFESLVQPIQFLEHIRKRMPMSDGQLDMMTSMHVSMRRRLDTLEVFHKGGQKAADEFLVSTLTGMDKLKSNAIAKSRRNEGGGGGSGSGNQNKRKRRGGGGPPTPGPGPQTTQPKPVFKCGKCNRLGHKTDNCLVAT